MHRSKKISLAGFIGGVALLAGVSTASACTYFQGTFTVTDVASSTYVTAWGCDTGAGTPTSGNHLTNGPTYVKLGNNVDLATGSTGTSAPAGVGNYCPATTGAERTATIPTSKALPSGTYDVYLQGIGYPTYQDDYGVMTVQSQGPIPGQVPPVLFVQPGGYVGFGGAPGCAADGRQQAKANPPATTSSPAFVQLGVLTVNGAGAISASYLPNGTTLTTTANEYTIPANLVPPNVGTQEAAICIQDRVSGTQHGNQVPVILTAI